MLAGDQSRGAQRQGLAEYADAFVDAHAFTIEEARRVLTAAREHGLGVRLHADHLADDGAAAATMRHRGRELVEARFSHTAAIARLPLDEADRGSRPRRDSLTC